MIHKDLAELLGDQFTELETLVKRGLYRECTEEEFKDDFEEYIEYIHTKSDDAIASVVQIYKLVLSHYQKHRGE